MLFINMREGGGERESIQNWGFRKPQTFKKILKN